MEPDNESGIWLRRAVVIAGLVVVLFYAVAWVLGRSLKPLQTVGQSAQCAGNVRTMLRAARMYADDFSENLPETVKWMDRIQPFLDAEKRLHCPTVGMAESMQFGYAANTLSMGLALSKIDAAEKSVLLFDSTQLVRNAADDVTSLPAPPRHVGRTQKGQPMSKGNWLGYVDGHGSFLTAKPAASDTKATDSGNEKPTAMIK